VNYNSKNILKFGLLLLLFIGIIVAFFQVDGQAIIEHIGLEKGYLFIGLLAFLGGISSFTGGIFMAVIATFALSGGHPILIGLIITPGMLTSDFIFYKLLENGKTLVRVPAKLESKFSKIHDWIMRQPDHIAFLVFVLVIGVIPMPGDITMAFMVSIKIKFKKIFWPFLFAHIVFGSLYAFLIREGVELFI